MFVQKLFEASNLPVVLDDMVQIRTLQNFMRGTYDGSESRTLNRTVDLDNPAVILCNLPLITVFQLKFE